jgi:arsenate reductase
MTAAARRYNVLFLCTANSARSIMAESLLRHWGRGRFGAYSAGSQPGGTVQPLALDLLRALKLPIEGLRSKSWDEFARPGAPPMDFIFTVCDRAAAEACPIWPGQPATAHWGVSDPAAATGDEIARRNAYREALRRLENRIRIFTELRIEALDKLALKAEIDRIGRQ